MTNVCSKDAYYEKQTAEIKAVNKVTDLLFVYLRDMYFANSLMTVEVGSYQNSLYGNILLITLGITCDGYSYNICFRLTVFSVHT